MPIISGSGGSGLSSGFTLITDTTLAVDTASFDFNGFPGTYIALRLVADLRATKAAATATLYCRLNNDSGSNYDYQIMNNTAATTVGASGALAGAQMQFGDIPGSTATAGRSAVAEITIDNYAGTTFDKNARCHIGLARGTSAGDVFVETSYGLWRNTAAVTRVTLLPDTGNFLAGSRCTLWGMT